jgi:hypothetical protein
MVDHTADQERITSATSHQADRSHQLVSLLASAAGFSAYLALLGGALLAIRFHHAGLPVTQAVGEVPFSTLITTALVELLLPAVAILLAFGFSPPAQRLMGLSSGSGRGNQFVSVTMAVIAAALFVPTNLYGLALLLCIAIMLFADRWVPEAAAGLRMSKASAAVVVLLAVAALPVIARQIVEPLNMEQVRVERQGQPTLVADLVAIRDSSIVIARCHHLFVLPMPTSTRVEELPSILGAGPPLVAELVELFHLRITPDVKPRPMPC